MPNEENVNLTENELENVNLTENELENLMYMADGILIQHQQVIDQILNETPLEYCVIKRTSLSSLFFELNPNLNRYENYEELRDQDDNGLYCRNLNKRLKNDNRFFTTDDHTICISIDDFKWLQLNYPNMIENDIDKINSIRSTYRSGVKAKSSDPKIIKFGLHNPKKLFYLNEATREYQLKIVKEELDDERANLTATIKQAGFEFFNVLRNSDDYEYITFTCASYKSLVDKFGGNAMFSKLFQELIVPEFSSNQEEPHVPTNNTNQDNTHHPQNQSNIDVNYNNNNNNIVFTQTNPTVASNIDQESTPDELPKLIEFGIRNPKKKFVLDRKIEPMQYKFEVPMEKRSIIKATLVAAIKSEHFPFLKMFSYSKDKKFIIFYADYYQSICKQFGNDARFKALFNPIFSNESELQNAQELPNLLNQPGLEYLKNFNFISANNNNNNNISNNSDNNNNYDNTNYNNNNI